MYTYIIRKRIVNALHFKGVTLREFIIRLLCSVTLLAYYLSLTLRVRFTDDRCAVKMPGFTVRFLTTDACGNTVNSPHFPTISFLNFIYIYSTSINTHILDGFSLGKLIFLMFFCNSGPYFFHFRSTVGWRLIS